MSLSTVDGSMDGGHGGRRSPRPGEEIPCFVCFSWPASIVLSPKEDIGALGRKVLINHQHGRMDAWTPGSYAVCTAGEAGQEQRGTIDGVGQKTVWGKGGLSCAANS